MRTRLTTLALLSLAFGLGACGSDDSATTPPEATTPGVPPSGGPNALLRQGTAEEGVNFATSPGGVTVDLNDNASDLLTALVQGAEVEVTCEMESGAEVVVGQGEWPADSGNATLTPDFAALSDDASERCSLSVEGSDVATATMEAVGGP